MENTESPKKRGRPKLDKPILRDVTEGEYNIERPKELLSLFSEGKLPPQVCKILHISKETFNNWLSTYPEFKKAYEIGMAACESFWIEEGIQGLRKEVKKFNFNQWISFMTNVFKWTRAANSENTTNINISSVNNTQYNKYTDAQLKSFLLGKLENSGLIEFQNQKKLESKEEVIEQESFKLSDGIVDAEIELSGNPRK